VSGSVIVCLLLMSGTEFNPKSGYLFF